MIFNVTILGCGAATPTSRFNPSAQVVNVHDKLFLVDCGEGTQVQLRRQKIKIQRINHIFISHLHGDHYLGLMGLLSTMHLLGRTAGIHLYGPPELKELVEVNLRLSDTWLVYPLEFHALVPGSKQLIHEDRTLEVHAFPLRHRIATWGYLFREKPRPLNMLTSEVAHYRLHPEEIISLKAGHPVERPDGSVITPEMACAPPQPLRAYAYCSDTAYWEPLAEFIRGADLLYHESTFLEKESARAHETYHSTAGQAARMAARAGVGQLMLGHFSSRYDSTDRFIEEAIPHFSNSILAEEGKTFSVGPVL